MKKKYCMVGIIFFLVISFVYRNLPQTFYQQDEWWGIGHILTEGFSQYLSHYSLIGLIAGSGRPFAALLQNALYSYSLFNTDQFAIFAIIFHFLNTLLLFLIVYKIRKRMDVAFVAGLFFATASVASQAVIWIGTNITTLPSAFFAFLSLYVYIYFIQSERKRFLYISFGLAIMSYFFRESTIFLFVLLPVMYMLFSKNKTTLFSLIKTHAVLIGYALLAIFLRLFELLQFEGVKSTSNVIGNAHPILRLTLHGILYPFESLSQMFPYPHNIFSLSDYFGKINYPRLWNSPAAPVAIETIGAELVSIILSGLLLVLFYIIYQYYKQNRKILIFALLLTFLSFLPYIALEKGNAFLDSRYFYIGVAGGGILIAIFLDSLRPILVKYLKLSTQAAQVLLLVLFLLFTYGNVVSIKKDVQMQVDIAKERKNILLSLSNLYPNLPQKPVFFIQSNADYYVVGNRLPFQQGNGYTLLVWYYYKSFDVVPKELLQEGFLWDILDQGYKEVGDKGFGYYSDSNTLKKDIQDKKVRKENIVALFYNSQSKTLTKLKHW